MKINWKIGWPFRKKRDKYKKFRLVVAGVGIILVWYGVWEYLYSVPFINNPLAALSLGLILLTASGLFFEEIA